MDSAETYECVVCHTTQAKGQSDEDAKAEMVEWLGDVPEEDQALICDECYHRIREGVCAHEGRGPRGVAYACLRPKGHDQPTIHASIDGKMIVTWDERRPGIRMRLRTLVDGLA